MTLAYLLARLRFAWGRAREEGPWWTTREIMLRGVRVPLWLLLLPFSLAAHLAGYRRLTVVTSRIGHLAAEIDCFLKLRALGRLPERRWLLLAPPGRVANDVLLDYWRPHLRVVTNPLACALIGTATRWGPARYDITDYVLTIAGPATYYRVNAEWRGRPPLLALTEEDRRRGMGARRSLGIPDDAWHVCVHARGPGYSQADERVHAHRNSDVTRLVPAIDSIVARGGWCIRMGDPSMSPLPARPGLVDYAHHPARSPFLDIFLCATCRFFLGSSSGLFIVSSIFGRPCALANIAPPTALGFAPGDLAVPKLVVSRRTSHPLTLAELMASPLANARQAGDFRSAEVGLVENTADEVVALVTEMLDGLDGTPGPQAREWAELQDRFDQLIRPWHFCFGAPSKVAASFLAAHPELL